MADKPPLRIALLLDSEMQPAWVRAMVEELRSSPVCEVVLVVLDASPAGPRRSFRERMSAYRRNFLYLLYSRLDARRFRSAMDPFVESDLSALFEGVPRLPVTPRKTKYCDYFDDTDVDRIRGFNLDVVIRLGFRILKGRVLDVARYGVWSYHHADNRVNRGGPPGFWEVVEHRPVTGAVLQILTEDLDNGRVIYRSYSATNPYSVTQNLRGYYWKAAAFVPRKLRDLYTRGADAVGCPDGDRYEVYSNRLYQQPTNWEMLRFLPRLIGRYLRQKLSDLGARDQWFLAYKLRSRSAGAADTPDTTLYNFTALVPPLDRFWADPFPIRYGDRHYVFFEEYPYKTEKGHISVLTIGDDGTVGRPDVALQSPYHLSYPNVFEWEGQIYMLPECVESGRVQLYRCTSFPCRWEPAATLLEEAGADPTLANIGGKWWLFVTLTPPSTGSWDDELHLYWADTPLGPWTPHPLNPVKSDVRSSRPAGRVFTYQGRWYRPAQDCAVRYGFGMRIQEILHIDERSYQEITVSDIRPNWRPGLSATHTLNAAGRLTVIDGQWRRDVLLRRRPPGQRLTYPAGPLPRPSVSI